MVLQSETDKKYEGETSREISHYEYNLTIYRETTLGALNNYGGEEIVDDILTRYMPLWGDWIWQRHTVFR